MAVRFDADGEAFVRTGGIGLTGNTIPYTYAGWVKRVVDRNTFSGVLSINDGTTADGDQITTGATGDLCTAMDVFGGGQVPGPTYVNDQWFYVAVAVSGTTRTFYWKPSGGAVSSASATIVAGRADNLTQLWVGDVPPAGEWFNGSACCVREWNAALNASELLSESNSPTPVRTANLQGAWRLSTIADTADVSGNGRTLTGGTGAVTDADEPADIAVSSIARPVSTLSAGTWTAVGAATIHEATAEASASFGEHAKSPNDPNNAPATVRLTSLVDNGGVIRVHIRYRKQGPDIASLVYQLRQGFVSEGTPGTLIATRTDADVSDAEGVIELTPVEKALIVFTGGAVSNLDVRKVADTP